MYSIIVKKYLDEIYELNDFLADHPETGSEEFESSKRHVELLKKHGIEVEYPFNNMDTAFRGIINKGKSLRLAILVEYDALRGMGHACGHCASGSISTLAALMLNELKDDIPAEINIIGTPDEEILGGKVYMVNDGVFDDIDAAIMIHMNDKTYSYMPFLALVAMEYEFFGVPSHAGAAPWEGKNALNALRLVFDGLDMMRQHVTPDVRVHGNIIEGGAASNIVPDYTKAEFLFRALSNKTVEYVTDWANDIGEGAALMTKTRFKGTQLGEKFYDLSSKPTGEKYLEKLLIEQGYEVHDGSRLVGGSSDIGNVDAKCPAFHPMLTIGYPYKPHTEGFAEVMKSDSVHKAIENGGIVIAKFLDRISKDSEFLSKIKKEHQRNRM